VPRDGWKRMCEGPMESTKRDLRVDSIGKGVNLELEP
jgi:hypothetical protein